MSRPDIILIIDDDDDDRSLFADAVQEVDPAIKCISAKDGLEGLNLLKSMDALLPNLILLDLNMPRMSGTQCLEEIKKDSRFSHIPVVIYSTTKRKEDVEHTHKLGAAHFLTKPTLFSEIRKEIAFIIGENWGK